MKHNGKISEYINNNKLDLEKIIYEYSGYVHKIIINTACNVLSNEDVEEIVSDTFFILWKNKDKLEEEKLLSSYIAGITKNLIKEKLRKLKCNTNIIKYEDLLQEDEPIDLICEEREKISVIEKTIKDMKKIDIEIFKLYYYSSRKINEIAEVLNVSEFNVKSRLYRIRKKIKYTLLKGGYNK